MQAATVIPFPPLRRLHAAGAAGPADDLELTPADLAAPAEGPAVDAGGAARPGPAGWEANLLLAVPLFVSPGAGGAGDVLAVLTAMLAFGLVGAAGPRPAARWLASAAVGTALAAAVGTGLALALVLFALLERCRRAIGARGAWLGPLLLAAGLALRLDAGAVALGLEPAPAMVAAGGALALFLALLARRRAAPPRLDATTRWRPRTAGAWPDLALLALAAGVVTLYAAALLGDPRIGQAAGVWPLLTVPLVGAALLRLWRGAGEAGRAARTPGADPGLVGLGAAWAGLLTVFLSGA